MPGDVSNERIRPDTGPDSSTPVLRELTDVRALRAITHPVRIALIELLTLRGPLTATAAGELIGESATTCSFHLRQLAKYGFVEEAGGGKGRSRPWKMSSHGMRIPLSDDAETEVAAGALSQMFRERQLNRWQQWRQARDSYPRPWRRAASESEYVLYLTAEELEHLSNELNALLLPRVLERLEDPSKRPAGAVPVELLLFAYPMQPPVSGEEG